MVVVGHVILPTYVNLYLEVVIKYILSLNLDVTSVGDNDGVLLIEKGFRRLLLS